MIRLLSLLFVTLFAITTVSFAQGSLCFRFFGLSIHPHGERENAQIMPLRLDDNAIFVQNLGGILSYEHPLLKNKDVFLAKCAIGLYADCAFHLGGFFHLGFRGRIFSLGRHRLYGRLDQH